MQIVFLVFLFVMGAVMGSFLCCQARRMKLREKEGGRISKRSVCLHCHKQLKWYDNIPIISWLVLGGKCRFCHKKIGMAEFWSEVLVAVAFLMLGVHFLSLNHALSIDAYAYFENISGIDWGIFGITLALTLTLSFLAIYDGLYGELPSLCLTISLIFAIILVALKAGNSLPVPEALAAGALFGGIYLVLYLVSRGRWVGDGDWILAGVIGLALGEPILALIAMFLANFLAAVLMIPAEVTQAKNIKRHKKSHEIYFGPFLVAAFVVVYCFAPAIRDVLFL